MQRHVKGSVRAPDGTFWMRADRRFHTDGREHRSIDRLLDLVRRYEKVLPYTANPSIEVILRAVRIARERLDEIEYEAVAVARGKQWSWRVIADVLGMSSSVAHRRFARDRPMRTLVQPRGYGDEQGTDLGELLDCPEDVAVDPADLAGREASEHDDDDQPDAHTR